MDEDQALALGAAVGITLIGLCGFGWSLYNMFVNDRILLSDEVLMT